MSHNFESSHQHDAMHEQFGAFYSGLLDEVLGFIKAVAIRQLSENEARVKVLARFEELLLENVPACHQKVAAYQSRVNAQHKAECDARVAYHARQQKQELAEAEFKKKSREAADLANRERNAKERKEMQEARDAFNAAQRAEQAEKDRIEADKAEELERRIQAIDGGQQ